MWNAEHACLHYKPMSKPPLKLPLNSYSESLKIMLYVNYKFSHLINLQPSPITEGETGEEEGELPGGSVPSRDSATETGHIPGDQYPRSESLMYSMLLFQHAALAN